MKSKATSFDIAYAAGVSQSTVSRALSDSPLVNPETRAKIKQIAADLNYKVDKNASNLRKQKSKTLALLLFEDPTPDDSSINPFFISMLGSITKATAKAGYDLLISFQNLSDDWHAVYEDSNKADGLILLGYGNYTDYEHKLAQLEEQETHFLRWGAPDKNHPNISIGSNNHEGGSMIAKHLISLGHKRFAFIGEINAGAPELKARYDGCLSALHEMGLEEGMLAQVDAISTEADGYKSTVSLLDKFDGDKQLDAIVCASDLMAIGAIRAINDRGLKVPQDIAVVGYDNIPASGFSTPGITTVQQNTMLAGQLLVTNLLKLIHNEEVKDILMQPELVVRRSCGNASN
ncbi:LacI family DNA-binding transcriptional regulator [Glaciecola sp. XM2]|jgi:DNA-binding LacI/PurR family transcriptional regulator|uniref:LacI family DNA-binding transcriptional regulator n=1 Tax=Glaciecola sp. XM2 TaxID=1914931 RepID=UPI001BDE67CF|nr:LacI family DNA-binding transcriptional regulator [Glaciecola sp. XM2]MBT1450338.1 LacI family DNA-binding transcriptional regulator [Glaciecola sp. XM2]